MSDPTKALLDAVADIGFHHPEARPRAVAALRAYFDAVPLDAHLFTPDSLAAALRDSSVYDMWDEDDGRYSDKDYATAIIQAAKEAE